MIHWEAAPVAPEADFAPSPAAARCDYVSINIGMDMIRCRVMSSSFRAIAAPDRLGGECGIELAAADRSPSTDLEGATAARQQWWRCTAT
jgi:hypothetical protein